MEALWGSWREVKVSEEERKLAFDKALFTLEKEVKQHTDAAEKDLHAAELRTAIREEKENGRVALETAQDSARDALRTSETLNSKAIYDAKREAEEARRTAEADRAEAELALKKKNCDEQYKTFAAEQAKTYYTEQAKLDAALAEVRAKIAAGEKEMAYIKEHKDAILAEKDGEIKGLNLMVTSLREQLKDALDFGKVLVGKLPEVNLSDLKIVVEAPAQQKGGGNDKGKGGGDQQKKE